MRNTRRRGAQGGGQEAGEGNPSPFAVGRGCPGRGLVTPCLFVPGLDQRPIAPRRYGLVGFLLDFHAVLALDGFLERCQGAVLSARLLRDGGRGRGVVRKGEPAWLVDWLETRRLWE